MTDDITAPALWGPRENRYAILMSVFVLALAAANVVSSKVVTLFGVVAPAGIVVYPVTFLITDVVSEVYGKGSATRVVWTGFVMMLLLLGITQAALWLPPAPFYRHQVAFRLIFSASGRIIIASLAAYCISQTSDVAIFHYLRHRTDGKHLWVRNNLATIISQLIDTVFFIFIAFYGVYPLRDCLMMIGGQFLCKVVFAVSDTPFVYLGVWWAKRG